MNVPSFAAWRNSWWRKIGQFENNSSSSPTVTNCRFIRNFANLYGGGMANYLGSSPTVINCTFCGNSAALGGGMWNWGGSSIVTNCTFMGNSAGSVGGVAFIGSSNYVNCIFWNNSDFGGMTESAQIFAPEGMGVVNYSIVQGGWSGAGGTGVLNSDPQFADAGCGSLRLSLGSPGIDSGDNDAVPPSINTDLEGHQRFVDEPNIPDTGNAGAQGPPIVDMGAHEFQPIPCNLDAKCEDGASCNGEEFCNDQTEHCQAGEAPCAGLFCVEADGGLCTARVYVDAGAIGANNGTSWTDAFVMLQDALAAAQWGSGEIWVAAGTYKPDQGGGQTPGDRTATFQLLNGVALYGGFAGTETQLSQRNIVANPTILSGDLDGNDTPVACVEDSPDCDSHGRLCGDDGFCIIADDNNENTYHIVTGSGTDATAGMDGFTITGGNSDGISKVRGAGMFNGSGSPTVTNCTFRGNSTEGYGGGMFNSFGVPTVTNCKFTGNSSDWRGGGMYNDKSSPTVTNCTFNENSASVGGGMYNYDLSSNPTVTNCTFSENSAASGGRGIYNEGGSPVVTNCIFWNNSDSGGPEQSPQIVVISGTPMVNYSIVQGGWSGAGGIGVLNANPLFANAPGGDLRLRAGSPGIDAGDTTALPLDTLDLDGDGNTTEWISLDLAGNPRLRDDPATGDTGVPGSAVVDMGAFEYFADCNANGVPDECDVDCGAADGPCDLPGCGGSGDCDWSGGGPNGVPDECDIAGCSGDVNCDDCNFNGTPDACDIAGDPGLDLDTNGVPDVCAAQPMAAPVPHDRAKNRYVSFAPNNPQPVAFRIEKIVGGTGGGWVGMPDANGLALAVNAPVTRVWPEPVVHVGDCEIVPDALYELRTSPDGGATLSPPLIVNTVARPVPKFWGDTVGSFDGVQWTAPNAIVNTNDFIAALQKFQNLPSAPHVTVVDVQSVSSTDPCLNRVTNIADVFILIQAFQGNEYPFTTDPAECPPCP